jgi:hypothetical protein
MLGNYEKTRRPRDHNILGGLSIARPQSFLYHSDHLAWPGIGRCIGLDQIKDPHHQGPVLNI